MSPDEIERLVKSLPEHFIKSWPDRVVNNVYFDTRTFRLYRLSSEGISNRKKIRIRWYGDTFVENVTPYLETKSKDGMIVDKLSRQLGNLNISPRIILNNGFRDVIPRTIPVDLHSDMQVMKPVLINRYLRRYYSSTKLDIRITVDSNLEFALPRHVIHPHYSGRYSSDMILELKYPAVLDTNMPLLTQKLPYRLARISKYVYGIGLFYGEL